MPSPYANLVKLLTTVNQLSKPGGATVKVLMDQLHLSKRSVFRLLEALNELGFPLTDERHNLGGEKTYRLLESYVKKLPNLALPGLSLTNDEAFFLDILLDSRASLHGPSHGALLHSLKQKLAALLPELEEDLRPEPSGDLSTYDHEQLLGTMRYAIQHYRACVITYLSFEGQASRAMLIHPLKMLERRGGIYLYAKLPDSDLVRLIDTDRVESLALLDVPFEQQSDLDAAFMFDSPTDLDEPEIFAATVRFSGSAVAKVNDRHFGFAHRIEGLPDGSCLFRVGAKNRKKFLSWILSFGAEAEVQGPADLRASIQREITKALSVYEGSLSRSD